MNNMNIQNSNINFLAKHLFTDKIKKLDENTGSFLPENVYFAEIEHYKKSDRDSVNTLRESWSDAKFIKIIANTLNWAQVYNAKNTKIYALTEQSENFGDLLPEKILGLAHITELSKRNAILEYMQIKPEAINVNKKKDIKYKGSGSVLLNSLKQIYNKIVLNAVADENIYKFYKRNGFRRSLFSMNTFIWHCNPVTFIKRLINK